MRWSPKKYNQDFCDKVVVTNPRLLDNPTCQNYKYYNYPENPQDYKTKCDFDMCFSEEALSEIVRTVGQKTPETGAKGFSPILSEDPDAPYKIGFDIVEFDEKGSQEASSSMYQPNEEWGTERVNFHLDADDMRLWAGDILNEKIEKPQSGQIFF